MKKPLLAAPFLLLFVPALAAAADAPPDAKQDPKAVEEGRAHFNKGVALFKDADYGAALVEFNRAYKVAPSFRIKFNVGQTCAELRDYVCALRAFRSYLEDGAADVPAARRATADKEIKRLEALVAHLTIVVNKEGADIHVDEVSVGTSPLAESVLVSAGRRRVTATLAPLAPVSSVVDVAGGDAVELKLDLHEPTVVVQAPAGLVSPPSASPSPSSLPSMSPAAPAAAPPSRAPLWIGLGVTGAMLAGTVVTGLMTLSAKSDLEAATDRFGVTRDEVDSARSKQENLAIVADVFAGATLVAAGVSAYLYFATSKSSGVGAAPGTIRLRASF